MSKGRYKVIDGVTRKVKKRYRVIDGVTRKVKKSYRVVDGITRLCFSAGAFGGYTGDFTVSQVEIDGVTHELYTLTSSGVLTLTDDAQFWMCGGGGAGGSSDASSTLRATGGAGGGHLTEGNLEAATYVIGIGNGGSYSAGGATTISSEDGVTVLHQANGGNMTLSNNSNGGDGGSGGAPANYSSGSTIMVGSAGKGDGVQTYPFGITALLAHCAGGGSGSLYKGGSYSAGRIGGTNGGDGTNTKTSSYTAPAAGGEHGGGAGGYYTTSSSTMTGGSGTFYGAGGGGAAVCSGTPSTGGWSKGYQGVCYLLIPA